MPQNRTEQTESTGSVPRFQKSLAQLESDRWGSWIAQSSLWISFPMLLVGGGIHCIPLKPSQPGISEAFFSYRSLAFIFETLLTQIGGALFTIGFLAISYERLSRFHLLSDLSDSLWTGLQAHNRIARSGIVAFHGSNTQKNTRIHTILTSAKRRIRIMNTYIPEYSEVERALSCLNKHTDLQVEILLIHPECDAAKQRSRDLLHDGPLQDDIVSGKVRDNLRDLDHFCRAANIRDRVNIRMYNNLPSFSLYEADDTSLVGWYCYGQPSFDSSVLEVRGERSELRASIRASFEIAWAGAVEYQRVPPSEAVINGIDAFSCIATGSWSDLGAAHSAESEAERDAVPQLDTADEPNVQLGSDLPTLVKRVVDEIRGSLELRSYAVVKGFPCSVANVSECERLFLRFGRLLGSPVAHRTGGTDYVGQIQAIDGGERRDIPTYSEHNREAEFHTDSNYKEHPERYVALLMIRKAACGGGVSSFVLAKDVVNELGRTTRGKRVLSILKNEAFAVTPPTKYKSETPRECPVIFNECDVRFRRDTIEVALRRDVTRLAKKKMSAVKAFADCMQKSQERYFITLEPGDILILDNHKVLHARTAFRDINRLMLRIRFNSHGA